ncbi:MAG: hypothetical protein CME66_09035 [Halobacteriovoraceae bacterium]|nr:hypothetical protein [Halobacteriovoraceae bacterium]
MNLNQEIHTLNGYIHNVVNLLKYIKEDALIDNEETKEMLDLALNKENEIITIIEDLKNKDL